MEITIDEINSRSDPYQLFLDSIRSPSTLRRYKNHLHTFLKLIPNQLYTDSLGKTPKDRDAITLATFFVELARKVQVFMGLNYFHMSLSIFNNEVFLHFSLNKSLDGGN